MADFTWRDGERIVRFGRGAIGDAAALIGNGYTLLSTERAIAMAPQIAAGASSVRLVAPGPVDQLAADLLGAIGAPSMSPALVALGGGRVIDVAKALGAVTGRPVAAIPTTLSAAEMTRVHRLPAGADQQTPTVRPRVVLTDPQLAASLPAAALAASAANALAHAIEGPLTTRSSPVPALAGEEGARLIDLAYLVAGEDPRAIGREQLALAALLAGYAIDACGYGLHHVAAQTLVRATGIGHGVGNAALLPHTIPALERRSPGRADADGTLAALATRIAARAGATRLRDLGVDRDALAACAREAAGRGQLELTPPRAEKAELLAIYEAAW